MDPIFGLSLAQPGFSFMLKTDVRFGAGAVRLLPDLLHAAGLRSIAVIVDAALADHPSWAATQARLAETGELVHVVTNSVTEPDYDWLEACRAGFGNRVPDVVVGVGGGSTLDLAKAISVLLTNPGPALQYRGFDKVKVPGPPVVAVPTTAGTGSEVTPNAVFTDRGEMRKLGINTPFYIPRFAILDAELTATCPRAVTLSSGMDALVHAVESFVARRSTPVSRLFSSQAFRLVFRALPAVLDAPRDLELRAQMQLGALYAGIGLMNSAPGPAGAMSYPLGVRYHVPHGLAGAVFLSRVAERNVALGYGGYDALYDQVAWDDQRAGSKSQLFVEALQDLAERVGVPTSLRAFGVTRADVPLLTEDTMRLAAAVEQNPVPFSPDDVRGIMDAMT